MLRRLLLMFRDAADADVALFSLMSLMLRAVAFSFVLIIISLYALF